MQTTLGQDRTKIACVHQGYELYGSDRSFISTVTALRATYPGAKIEVVLPREGPIGPLLTSADSIAIEPLWVLRRKRWFASLTSGLVRLPLAIVRAWSRMRRSDVVYINTSVIADYMLAARFATGKTILHIHEIPQGLTLSLLRALVRWSRAEIVFNSKATRDAFGLPAADRARIIYNGIAGPSAAEPTTYDGGRPLRLLMLGRLSRIKGQEVLIEALLRLHGRCSPEVRIVGDAFEDDAWAGRLQDLVDRTGLSSTVRLMPFDPDPAPHYRWADVVVVPSRLPESLGRVAIEAMAYGRPPLVSAIGGLGEVVKAGETGWLVEPGSPESLAAVLRRIIDAPAAWQTYGVAGRRRYEALFSEAAMVRATAALLDDVLRAADRHGTRADLAPSALGGQG